MGKNTQSAYDILIKPQFDHGGGGILAERPGSFTITTPDGRSETVTAGGAKGHQGWKAQSKLISSGLPEGSTISYTSSDGSINESYNITTGGGKRHEFAFGSPDPITVSDKGALGSFGGGGGYQSGSTFGGGFVNGVASPTFVDASGLAFNPVIAQPVPLPDYQNVDPLTYTQQVGDFNRANYLSNLGVSQQSALGMIGTEFAGLSQFAPQASLLQQQLASSENQFNQGQVSQANTFNPSQVSAANIYNRDQFNQAIDASGAPIRQTIQEGLADARQRAKGFLPTSIQDKAFEMAARSQAGDSSVSAGLGTSAFTQNAIDKYTINERLNLAREGQADAQTWMSNAASLLIDAPIKYNPLLSQPLTARTSQDVRGMPTVSGAQLQQSEQANLGNLSSMSPAQAASMKVQQNQFGANLQNNVNQFNSQLGFNAQAINSQYDFAAQLQKLSVDGANASAAYGFAQNVASNAFNRYQQEAANYQAQSQGAGMWGNVGSIIGGFFGPSKKQDKPLTSSDIIPTADVPIMSNPDGSIGYSSGATSYPVSSQMDGSVGYSEPIFKGAY
jgi:hypothetical protein